MEPANNRLESPKIRARTASSKKRAQKQGSALFQTSQDTDASAPASVSRTLKPFFRRVSRGCYADRCAACHGDNGGDPKYRALVGGRGPLTSAELSENLDWLLGGKPVLTIGRFWPYATTLWSYINRAQPFDEPGSLTHDEVYAVTAYLLYLNGIIGEADVLDARTLPAVKMPNRDGFVPDSRPDVGKARLRGNAERPRPP